MTTLLIAFFLLTAICFAAFGWIIRDFQHLCERMDNDRDERNQDP